MAQDDISEAVLAEGQRALQAVDPSAYLVLPRILRRLVLQSREITGLSWHVPHRKCYLVSREQLLRFVAPDELGVEQVQTIPEQVILISRPDRDDLPELTAAALQTYIWRLLFHSRVHRLLDNLIASEKLTQTTIRLRIDRIGQSEFDEVRAVLRRENFLFPQQDPVEVYAEFVAVYCELRKFSPSWRRSYFPSIHDFDLIDEIVREDLDFDELFVATRLTAAVAPVLPASIVESEPVGPTAAPIPPSRKVQTGSRRAERIMETLLKRAEKLAAQGNSVRAAILRTQACKYSSAEVQPKILELVDSEISRLTERLRVALGFDENDARDWHASLGLLVRNALHGFWNNDARLLFDLQKVCVDHEREISVVDLVGWVWSLGRQPLRRPLPNQREVLMSKHLRSATGRIPTTNLAPAQRGLLSRLLHSAARSAEEQLRTRLRPLIGEALQKVGLEPQNLPERVARRKLIEELSDVVVHRGFLTIGNLRDSISSNNLKLFDLETFQQFLRGDQLLRADRELSRKLDGVYNPAEFYMRWLQRLSSLAFGTRNGRFITQYVAIPFGGAVVILEGLDHLVHAFSGLFVHHAAPIESAVHAVATEAVAHAEHSKIFMSWPTFIGLGFFLMALMHVTSFRKGVVELLRLTWKILRVSLYDTPLWLIKLPVVQSILRSQPVVFFRQVFLLPLIATAMLSLVIMPFYSSWNSWGISTGVLGLALCIILNSRMGRDLEEVSSEYVMRLIHRIGVRFLLSLFELIMDTFKRILEFIERLLYAVDEWLRFKSGESDLTLIAKALLGVVWGAVTFVVRFAVNLLIEPQINPIKHFPVVTVAHKIIFTTMNWPLTMLFHKVFNFNLAFAGTLATMIVLTLPGACGFIVWELKENWRLFAANRSKRLLPARIGSHGETLIRLMKPGLHSGTLPKLYSKLRRAERKAHLKRWKNAKAVCVEKLHHVEESVRHFVERDFFMLLYESRGWGGLKLELSHVEAASNSLRIDIRCPSLPGSPLRLAFEEQSGWLLAGLPTSGWVWKLSEPQLECLKLALAGIYKLGGVDLIREQITSQFAPREIRYDVADQGLVVWPDKAFDVEVRYYLDDRRLISPRPRRVAREYQLPDLDSRALIYNLNSISWRRWVDAWTAEQEGRDLPVLFAEEIRMLPRFELHPEVETKPVGHEPIPHA
ncbi:MAG: hypothetical protein JWN70_6807 [Planctomycetaceae bacterium]|nr:hypothetical protein [Planctomycetaceae bacterium]